jgi:hypothetical protein
MQFCSASGARADGDANAVIHDKSLKLSGRLAGYYSTLCFRKYILNLVARRAARARTAFSWQSPDGPIRPPRLSLARAGGAGPRLGSGRGAVSERAPPNNYLSGSVMEWMRSRAEWQCGRALPAPSAPTVQALPSGATRA